MIDLHTHTLLSDGELLPSELARRAENAGYKAVGITDHVDGSNIDFILPRIKKVCLDLSKKIKIKVLAGIELTHIPPSDFRAMAAYARDNGIRLVVAHGETIAEPVAAGTNRAAIEAGVDILAHPGLISLDDARLAAEKGVFLEITSRSGHSLTNGHVAKIALAAKAKLILNTDTHSPENLINLKSAEKILAGAGLDKKNAALILTKNSGELVRRILK